MAFVVDPTRFDARGAFVLWNGEARRLGIPGFADHRPSVQLRWMLNAELGFPTEPFRVWSRPHTTDAFVQALTLVPFVNWLGAANLYTWTEGSVSSVFVTISAPALGTVVAFSGAPRPERFCASAFFPAGGGTFELRAQTIDGVLLPPGATVTAARGVLPGRYANTDGWRLVEVVGLPVGAAWSGIGQHTRQQGLVTAPTDPVSAAIQRLTRGAPPFGWGPEIAPGVAAPAWRPPDPRALIVDVNGSLLDLLAPIVGGNPPDAQAKQTVATPLPPPVTSSGQQMSGAGTKADVSPLTVAYLGAATDPFLCLALGFGTAYDEGSQFDFMVTARWEAGLDGRSAPFDLAAIVPGPVTPGPPVQPANLVAELQGLLRPIAVDGPWRATTRLAWDRVPSTPLAGAVSAAAARAGIAPAAPAIPLLAPRRSGGLSPIAINASTSGHPPDPDPKHVNIIDREMPIPQDPGTAQVAYGVAVQDIWGIWSTWASVGPTIAEPPPEPLRIVKLSLIAEAPGAGSVCPATLEVEFLLDWRIRTPGRVSFVGNLYAAAEGGAAPPSNTPPAGLDRGTASGGPPLDIDFAGDVPSAPGVTIQPLTEGGEEFAAGFGAAQGQVSRRYRMTLTGLGLDFAGTPFVGIALWGLVQARIPPQRASAFGARPAVASASDPRPPVIVVRHVKLASLPDAGGSCHAVLAWDPPAPPALGYHIYEAAETPLLDALGKPQPEPGATLDARLKALTDAFNANPLRHPFTRLNATPFTGTSLDVTLPRGSMGIHCYVVLGISPSLVEAPWPAAGSAESTLMAVGIPRIARPAPPIIEVDRILDTTTDPPSFKAVITVSTRPGHRAKRVDLHRVRVDDAARELDTMGPPIASLLDSAGGWDVQKVEDAAFGAFIGKVTGEDAPGGSWRRVWYRAVAWSGRDDTRGLLPGRSPPSDAAWVVLPPSAAPAISAPVRGGSATDVTLQWSSAAPVARTPLGSHLLTVRAVPPGAPALVSLDSPLDALDHAPPATGSGVWISASAAGATTYQAILRRASAADPVQVLVRITDPLGRVGEQMLTIGAGGP
ncbi:hypothetical protein [Paracraurococcus lichenis]|uniref:Tip attachment protein J domain-containing protein n=1 Tax=Paracraurococcus lichenis TaxID=3064888 RepID=A0ABT9E7S7_9PROT|nr:hypothetical protein [Paracraurococcus sp. LOR1-02]MDO9712258.1 hypothetical protein [Paracraurococcus sp. LOR1-02]